MQKKYSVSLLALAITVSSMTTVWAQTTTTETTQEQAQPATDEPAKQDAPAIATEPAKSDAAAATEPVKEEAAQPAAQETQPATTEAAPAPEAEPAKQDAAAPEPAKVEQAQPATQETQPPATEPVKTGSSAAPDSAAPEPVKDETAQPAKQETPPAATEAAPAPETDPAKQEASPAPKPTDPAKESAAQPQSEEPVQQQAQPVEDAKPVVTVDSVLGDDRPAAEVTDAELRQRIQAAGELTNDAATKGKQKTRLQAKAEADKAELSARNAAATGVTVEAGAADAEAAKITGDTRPAAELDDDALRERIQQTRGVLAAEGLSDTATEQLRATLSTDTTAIRQRVSARRTPETEAAVEPGKANNLPEAKPGKMTVGDLTGDDRPANDLTTNALQRRIDANRRALTLKDLSDRETRFMRKRLEQDREELGERLVDRRKRRKKGLSTNQAIVIGAGLVAGAIIASRPTIAAAEAYDEELEDWLISPPLVKVKPRYRIEDFAEQPRLRYSVPGIEVDTIRFGFGEGYLRTEEVSKLERIGEIIERIVAGNPNEVFLIEGHTDAVGSREANMALSTQRADAVRQALLEYFEIGEDNLATVGRGEAYLKIPTEEPEAENRRVTLRRITPLLAGRN